MGILVGATCFTLPVRAQDEKLDLRARQEAIVEKRDNGRSEEILLDPTESLKPDKKDSEIDGGDKGERGESREPLEERVKEQSKSIEAVERKGLDKKEVSYPRLNTEGEIRLQYDSDSLGAKNAEDAFPAKGGIAPYKADSRIFIRRFRPLLALEFNPNFRIYTKLDAKFDEDQIHILDIAGDYRLSSKTNILFGRFKGPLRQQPYHTIERLEMVERLYTSRAVGVMGHHKEPKLGEFWLGAFVGSPLNSGGAGSHQDIAARARFNLSKSFKAGFAGQIGTFHRAGSDSIPIRLVGGDIIYNIGKAQILGETLYSDGYNKDSKADTRAFGYSLGVAYPLSRRLDFILNYDRYDPDIEAVDAAKFSNGSNGRDRKIIGLNYYFNRKPERALMVNYEFRQSLEGPSVHTSGLRVRYVFTW